MLLTLFSFYLFIGDGSNRKLTTISNDLSNEVVINIPNSKWKCVREVPTYYDNAMSVSIICNNGSSFDTTFALCATNTIDYNKNEFKILNGNNKSNVGFIAECETKK